MYEQWCIRMTDFITIIIFFLRGWFMDWPASGWFSRCVSMSSHAFQHPHLHHHLPCTQSLFQCDIGDRATGISCVKDWDQCLSLFHASLRVVLLLFISVRCATSTHCCLLFGFSVRLTWLLSTCCWLHCPILSGGDDRPTFVMQRQTRQF